MKFDKPEDIINIGKGDMPPFNKLIIPGMIIFLVLILVFTSFYSIDPDEMGIVLRFGKYIKATNPGLHFKIPFGIDKVTAVKVKYVFKQEFGFRTLRAGVRSQYAKGRGYLDESLMLTGDLNVAVVEWIVQYKIKDPVKYLFNIRNPESTIIDIAEVAMRRAVGDNTIDEVLLTRRVEIANEVGDKLQKILDFYNTGIHIVTVKLQDVNPPERVKPAFNEVNEAKQEKERMINEAQAAYNKRIPRAKGEAEKTIRNAEGYAIDRINRAQGEAKRFLAMLEEYDNAKEVTRKRLYLETLSEILPKVGKKYIIDPSQKSLLPLLKLKEEK